MAAAPYRRVVEQGWVGGARWGCWVQRVVRCGPCAELGLRVPLPGAPRPVPARPEKRGGTREKAVPEGSCVGHNAEGSALVRVPGCLVAAPG